MKLNIAVMGPLEQRHLAALRRSEEGLILISIKNNWKQIF